MFFLAKVPILLPLTFHVAGVCLRLFWQSGKEEDVLTGRVEEQFPAC
jgi:hypothetical protein